ncbi:hypothetical protein D3C80_1612950 [compost metagenome]
MHDFVDLFIHLVQYRPQGMPVEADRGATLLDFVRLHQRRQRLRDIVQRRMQLFFGSLASLQLLPARRNGFAVCCIGIAEDMRVAALQFVADGVAHLIEVEQPLLLAHLGVKHHLEQQIAQFITQIGIVLALNGIQHFVGFFQGVRRDGGEGLLTIPRATHLRIAQGFHNGQQAL